jgi:hypothetical protein
MWSLIAVAHLALIGVLALYPDEFLSGGLKDAVVEVLGVAVFCLVVAGGAIAGDVWVSERLGDDSLVHVVAGAIAVAAGMLLIEAVKDFRKA